jgi:hypothetical protein
MRSFDDLVIFEGVPEVFLGDGPHVLRAILNPDVFKNCLGARVSVVCSAGRPAMVAVDPWGRKMRISFGLTEENQEGLFRVRVSFDDLRQERERSFWVIR